MPAPDLQAPTLAVAVTALLFAGAAPVSARPAEQSARAFIVETTWQSIRAQYGRVWAKIHPRYQRVTTREKWEACQRRQARETAGFEWLSVRATDSYPDVIRLPLLGRTTVTAVSVAVVVRHPLTGRQTVRDTFYVKKVGGRWKGLWTPEMYAAYKAGRCPGT